MAAISTCYLFIKTEQQLWLLYLLASMQYACQSFYDPARCAAIMTVVPGCQVHIAAALDTMCYSLMAVLGGAAGAAMVQWSGPSSCFLTDSACGMLAAMLLAKLVPVDAARLHHTGARAGAATCRMCSGSSSSSSSSTGCGSSRTSSKRKSCFSSLCCGNAGDAAADAGDAAADDMLEPLLMSAACDAEAASSHQHAEDDTVCSNQEHQAEAPILITAAPLAAEHDGPQAASKQDAAAAASTGTTEASAALPEPAQHCTAATEASQQGQDATEHATSGLATIWAGIAYLAKPVNVDLALLTLAKGTAALVWGAADVINGRLATEPIMMTFGDAATTLGCMMAAIGIGCILGPLLGGLLIPARASAWRWALSGHIMTMAVSYALMAAAPNIYCVIVATLLRTIGANNLWVESTGLMQLRIDEHVKGHVFALEFTLYTISEGSSAFAAGWLLDEVGLDVFQLCMSLAGLGCFFAFMWMLYAIVFRDCRVAPLATAAAV
jgi:predicted MFS family arabinose efflux permease